MGVMFLNRLELARQVRITDFIRVEVADMDPDPMLHFACPQIVQKRSPTVVLFQIFSHTFGDEDVTGITTIHHSLRQVDPGAGNVLPLVYVSHFADRTAVNPHSQGDPRMFFQGSRNFQSALRRRFGICAEN